MTEATAATMPADTRKSGRFLYGASVVFLCAWVIVPIYFLLINTLSSPEAVNSFPKSFIPEFDFGSLQFFAGFAGILTALKNSVIVALMTMVMSIIICAPAGYALSRFEFPGKGLFRAAANIPFVHPTVVVGTAFLALVGEKDYEGALRKIKEKNFLPAICGRVCPQEDQCEMVCTLNKPDKGREPGGVGRVGPLPFRAVRVGVAPVARSSEAARGSAVDVVPERIQRVRIVDHTIRTVVGQVAGHDRVPDRPLPGSAEDRARGSRVVGHRDVDQARRDADRVNPSVARCAVAADRYVLEG